MSAGCRSSPVLEPTVTVPRPQFQWEPGSYGIEDILKTHQLPVTVQCDLTNCISRLKTLNFDLSQPLLLYKTRENIVETSAVSVMYDKISETFKEVDETFLIPQDYKGWFAVLGNPEKNKKDRAVPHYRQVEKLATSKCETFLIGGSETVEAVEVRRGQNITHLIPGDVLKKRNVFKEILKVKSKGSGSKGKLKDRMFLMCTDEQDREFMIPMEQRGIFYMISGYHSSATLPILQMSDMTEKIKYPCLVKLLYGRQPTTPCLFTGALLLKESCVKSSVIVSTVLNLKNVLLEIPVEIELKFRVAVKTADLLSNPGYRSALALCSGTAETYSRSMKILPQYHFLKNGNRLPKTASVDLRQETPPQKEMDVPRDLCSNTTEVDGLYVQVWDQKMHSPNTPTTDKTTKMDIRVPLDKPVSGLQPPPVLHNTELKKTPQASSITQYVDMRNFHSAYEKLILNEPHRLRVGSNEYDKLLPYKTGFIFDEECCADHQDENSFKSETSIPEKEPDYQNCIFLENRAAGEVFLHNDITSDAILNADVDDLPLGADSLFFRRPRSTEPDSGVETEEGFQKSIGRLPVLELCDQLRQLGLKSKTVNGMKNRSVDGRLLQKLNENELRETFPEMTNIELKKLTMFLQGWKPQF